MELENKHIVITGGTAGIGRELVRALHPNNRLCVLASNAERLAALEDEFKGIGVCQVDLGDAQALQRASIEALEALGRIDLLVHNAAVQYTPAFTDEAFDLESVQSEVTVNLTAVCTLTAMLLPALLESPQAMILHINSGLALAPKTSSAVYCATKAALNSLTQSLRYQLAETNVAVAQAFLPLVDTAMTEGRGAGKLSASAAAAAIVRGVERDVKDNYVGKVKLLAAIMRLSPTLGRKIMRSN